MNYDEKIYSRLQEKEEGMRVELGDDATYLVKGLDSISFRIHSSDILELNGA
jgi:hypothetical protein